MRTLIHILACSFCVLVVFAEDKFWVDANEEDRLWVNAKINGKVAGLSMDTGWGGENIILFRGAADRLGLKVRPYQGTGVGQIPFAVTQKCVVKLRWSFWSVTRVVGESGVIEWPSHVTQAIEDRFGERGFDGFVPWGLVSDKIIELDASNQTLRFLNKVPKEAAGWTKLALRKDWGILALETENPDGGKGVILVDTGSASGVGLATQKGREWKAAHTNQPVRLIMGYMVQPGLIVREQAWSDELSLGDLKLTDVVIEEADALSLEKTRTVESMQVNRNGSVRPRFHCHGHVVLCVLVSMAHLCGSASGRPAASANNAQSGRASVRKVDFSEVPEVIGNEMYPKILALLADDSSKLPRQFDIVFMKNLVGNFGQTVGATINLRAEWLAKNPIDLDQTLIHEMSHVAQKYPSKACDYWGEGIADYVSYKLGYTNEWNWPHCSFEYPHYTSGHCCAGAFLTFVDATYGSNVVRELNSALRRGSYSDSFFAKATGKSVEALWTEFQKAPAFTPVAAETLELQAELGYVNGQPPKDIGRRLTAYLLQQPGGALTLEAREFLAKLIENDQLPGILKVQGREFSWGIGGPNLRKEASSAGYPALRTFCGSKTDDPSAYYCIFVRLSKDSGWKLQRAWRAGPAGRVIEEYPIP